MPIFKGQNSARVLPLIVNLGQIWGRHRTHDTATLSRQANLCTPTPAVNLGAGLHPRISARLVTELQRSVHVDPGAAKPRRHVVDPVRPAVCCIKPGRSMWSCLHPHDTAPPPRCLLHTATQNKMQRGVHKVVMLCSILGWGKLADILVERNLGSYLML